MSLGIVTDLRHRTRF